MKIFSVLFCILLVGVCSCHKQAQDETYCPEVMDALDKRPAFLVIGDSISIAYTKPLQTFYPKYQVIHNECNGRSSSWGVKNIERWTSHAPSWDFCTFNHGIWDISRNRPDMRWASSI
ncbi:MAG: hypothetical protein JNM93_07805, partial [Bacteriovoracaceae bacterium]|nr:hypothetical protein [Bacteriovoracaceae bacterium]